MSQNLFVKIFAAPPTAKNGRRGVTSRFGSAVASKAIPG
jgi:hypothetical protein